MKRRGDPLAIVPVIRKRQRRVSIPRRRMVVATGGLAPPRTGGFFGVATRRSRDERKVIDVDPATYGANTTGTVTLLNGVATGTDFTDRIGRKIIMKSLYIRGVCKPEDDNIANTLARVLIVYDMQSNGAAPVVTDVLKSATSASQLNMNNRDRFKVLMDKQYAVGKVLDTATQAFAGSPTIHQLKKYKRLNLEVLFNGTTNVIGSIATGSVYMITIGNQAAGLGAEFLVSTRIRFIDA